MYLVITVREREKRQSNSAKYSLLERDSIERSYLSLVRLSRDYRAPNFPQEMFSLNTPICRKRNALYSPARLYSRLDVIRRLYLIQWNYRSAGRRIQ